jgi:hypothetical protein
MPEARFEPEALTNTSQSDNRCCPPMTCRQQPAADFRQGKYALITNLLKQDKIDAL